MQDKIEKKRLAILHILSEHDDPLGSKQIMEILEEQGSDISERTIRFHLLAMDQDGLTTCVGRSGRLITDKGMEELDNARIHEKVGFLTAKIHQMTYKMNFNLEKESGSVVVNVSMLPLSICRTVLPLIQRVYEAGYAMGARLTVFSPGEKIGTITIPADCVGIGTVCSITINGVFLQYGIPTTSRFGGLLELKDYKPTRFVAIINYDGTTIDPLEIFIKSGMTDYSGATRDGNGKIGASFREVPADARQTVLDIEEKLRKIGLGSIMKIGWPGKSLFDIPVNMGHIGLIVIGGLNPVAILEEQGYKLQSSALSGIIPYERLFHYRELEENITPFL